MPDIRLKRIYEPAAGGDDFRVLADRLWPRGMKKDRVLIDLWAKEIAPATVLRTNYHDGIISWQEFENLYHIELLHNPAMHSFIQTIQNRKTVTLLFAGKDSDRTHAKIIREFILEVAAKN